MTGTYIFAALALVAAGVTIGILVMIGLGIKRDDHPGGFPAETHDWTAHAARRVVGVGARGAELGDETRRRQDFLPVLSLTRLPRGRSDGRPDPGHDGRSKTGEGETRR